MTDVPLTLGEVVTNERLDLLESHLTNTPKSTAKLADLCGLSRPDALLNLRALERDKRTDRDVSATNGWVRPQPLAVLEQNLDKQFIGAARRLLNVHPYPARRGARSWAGYLRLNGWGERVAHTDGLVLQLLVRHGPMTHAQISAQIGVVSNWTFTRLRTGKHRDAQIAPLIEAAGFNRWQLRPEVADAQEDDGD